MFKKLFSITCLLVCLVYILWQDSFDSLKGEEYIFLTETGEHKFNLKIADTYEKKQRGLMYIESMPENSGMIFINKEPTITIFWMKGTYIPLDLIFLNENKKVVHIHQNAPPLDEYNKISSILPVKYTVELNAGMASKVGIQPGSQLICANN